VTTWSGTIAAGPETVNLTASAPDYTTADIAVTVQVLAPYGHQIGPHHSPAPLTP